VFRRFPQTFFPAALTALTVCFACIPMQGEVFWLRPFRSGAGAAGTGSGLSAASVAELDKLPGSDGVLHKEPITVNGVKLELLTCRSTRSLADLTAFFQQLCPGADLSYADRTLRVAFRRNDGMIERWLLTEAAPGMPVTAFRIISPEKLPPPGSWPGELPRLPGEARAVQVIEFQRTGGIYGAFDRAGGDPHDRLRDIDSQLRAEGWVPAGNEAKSAIGGNGDLYLYPGEPRRVLLVSQGENGMGGYFVRQLKK